MDFELLQKLKDWRARTADKEDVELFRVLSNNSLQEIAEKKPNNKEELTSIKGIKDKKFMKYGESILAIVNEYSDEEVESVEAGEETAVSVSAYLDSINTHLQKKGGRVQGEISSLDIRGSYLFFSLKDKNDESLLNCFMWRSNYDLCGVSIEEGMEIIAHGLPEVHKPSGRFSLHTLTVELVGEGALKIAYEKLKKKLAEEGVFAPEKKKAVPEFPQKIGLITSETGAVIHDFLNNLGKHAYKISFYNSRVEGQAAVRSMLSAIHYFEGRDIDALVIIRGGGSLESLQAFNNEVLVRKIAEFDKPVICGIGHDKDVPLASYAADRAVSTPTAVTKILDESWDKASANLGILEKGILHGYEQMLGDVKYSIEAVSNKLSRFFGLVFKRFRELEYGIKSSLANIFYAIKEEKKKLADTGRFMLDNLSNAFSDVKRALDNGERGLKMFDPERQLKLGYSIVSSGGKIVRSIKQIKRGDKLDIKVSDGRINTEVEDIIK